MVEWRDRAGRLTAESYAPPDATGLETYQLRRSY